MTLTGEKKEQRSRSAEQSRRALLLAARVLFARKGYDGTSVKEIAHAAGVNVSLVSYYFDGKEGIYRACFEAFGNAKRAIIERILRPAASEEEFRFRIRMFVEEMLTSFVEDPETHRIFYRDMELENPVMQDIFREKFLPLSFLVLGFFKDAKKQGFLRKNIDPQWAVPSLMGMLSHFVRSAQICQKFFGNSFADKKCQKSLAQQVVTIFCDGVTDSGRSS